MKLLRNCSITTMLFVTLIPVAEAQQDRQATPPHWNFINLYDAVSAGIGLLIIVVAGYLLVLAARNPNNPIIYKLRPSFFFWLGMAYAALLMLLAIAYNASYRGNGPYLVGGLLPIAVPWFGALGAVTISLEGVFHWSESRWNPDYNYWHIGRPVFGAVLGIIGFFLFVLIVSSSGTTPPFLDPTKPTSAPKDFIAYYVVAFLVGYREETFRELIRRVTDMILKPATPSAGLARVSFKSGGVTQSEVKFPATAAGASASLTIEIVNSGDGPLVGPALTFTPTDASSKGIFDLTNDHVTGIGELGPGEKKTVDITFHPAGTGTYSGLLSVTAKNLTPAPEIRVTGSAP